MTPDFKQGFLAAVKIARCGGLSLSASARAIWEELVIEWIARDDDSDPPTAGTAGFVLGHRRNPKPAVAREDAVNLAAVPALGTEIAHKGQRYTLLRTEPYTRKNGIQSTLLVWQSPCAECGRPFEAKSGLKAKALNRRCPEHVDPRRRVRKQV